MATLPDYSINYFVPLSASSSAAIGQLMLPDAATGAFYVVATSDNRGTRRCEGIAISNWSGATGNVGTIRILQSGVAAPSISGLGAGSASWVRCSTTGVPERFAPSLGGSSDVIGWCETDGRLHLMCGVFTETIVVGGGSGSPPGAPAHGLQSSDGAVTSFVGDSYWTMPSAGVLATAFDNATGEHGIIAVRFAGDVSGLPGLGVMQFSDETADNHGFGSIVGAGFQSSTAGNVPVAIWGVSGGVPYFGDPSMLAPTQIYCGGQGLTAQQNGVNFVLGTTGKVSLSGSLYSALGGPGKLLGLDSAGNIVVLSGASGITGTYTLEQFGAVGDGVTDDHAAFTAANVVLTGGNVTLVLMGKTYLTSVGLLMGVNTTIKGQGPVSVLKTTSNIALVDVNSSEDTLCEDFTLLGSGAGSTQRGWKNGTVGVAGSGTSRAGVVNVVAKNLGSAGFYYAQNPVDTVGTVLAPRLTSCAAIGCGTSTTTGGFVFDVRGEYVTSVNCVAEQCSNGFLDGAGNLSFIGCGASFNTVNLFIEAGGGFVNDSHGEWTGGYISHPTAAGTNIQYGGVNGYNFSGCSIYEGTLLCTTNAVGLCFIGCHIDVTGYTFQSGTVVEMLDCTSSNGYGNSTTNVNAASKFIARGCIMRADTTMPSWLIPYASVSTQISALNIDWSLDDGNFYKTLSSGSNVITFSNVREGQTINVTLTGASSTVTWPTAKWPGGSAPTQTASGTDVYTFKRTNGVTYGAVQQAFA